MRLLVHCCCGPCAGDMLLRELPSSYTGLVPYWFNPNIHPWTEYRQRLSAFRELCRSAGLEPVIDDEYDAASFLRLVLSATDRGEDRCTACYRLRLDRAASVAKRENCPEFTTSLLASPRQQHELIIAAGERVADRDAKFRYRDFRPGYRQAVQLSRDLGLYRQQYCGCILSEQERYLQNS